MPAASSLTGCRCRPKKPHFLHFVDGVIKQEADQVAGLEDAVKDPEGDDDAPVGVVEGIEDEGGQGLVPAADGRWDMGGHSLQDVLDADPLLGRTQDGQIRVQPELPVDLILDHLHVRGGQVDLVDHRDNGQIVFHGQVKVGQGLGLHPLGGVHHQEHPLAGGQGPADFVGKIHMAGGVNEIKVVLYPILGFIRAG